MSFKVPEVPKSKDNSKKREKKPSMKLVEEPPARCKDCNQLLSDVVQIEAVFKYFENGGVQEFMAVRHPPLRPLDQVPLDPEELDDLPSYHLTSYIFYDVRGHIVAIDREMPGPVYFHGYMKTILDDTPRMVNGLDMYGARLQNWWFTDTNGATDPREPLEAGVSSRNAHYFLVEPHPAYAEWAVAFMEKYRRQ